jgi:hypothetical protein
MVGLAVVVVVAAMPMVRMDLRTPAAAVVVAEAIQFLWMGEPAAVENLL